MPYPTLTFANQLEQMTRQELEQFISLLQGYLSKEHKETGAHAALTSDTIVNAGTLASGDMTATNLTLTGPATSFGTVILARNNGSAQGVSIAALSDVSSATFIANSNGGGAGSAAAVILTSPDSAQAAFTQRNGQTLIGVGNTSSYLSVDSGIAERSRTTAMGVWISVAFAAGNFTANAGGTWTLQSGDQDTLKYMLVGKTMFVTFYLNTTTIVGAPTVLSIAIPGGFTGVAAGTSLNSIQILDNGVRVVGHAYVPGGATTIDIFRFDVAAFTANVNNTIVRGTLAFEVA